MSKFKLSSEQEAIVKARGNIIVSAGAGSGKTFTLVERLFERIVSGKNIDDYLVITFTKLAATELLDRLSKKIYENYDLIVDAKKQIERLHCAYISTFDSFVIKVIFENIDKMSDLKKYSITSSYKLLTSINSEQLKEIAFKKSIDYLLDNDKDFYQFIFKFSSKSIYDIRDFIINIADKIEYETTDIEIYSNTFSRYFDNYLQLDSLDNHYLVKYKSLIKEAVVALDSILESLLQCELKKEMESEIRKIRSSFIGIEYKSLDDIYRVLNTGKISFRASKETSALKTKYNTLLEKVNKQFNTDEKHSTIESNFLEYRYNMEQFIKIIKTYRDLLILEKNEIESFEYLDLTKAVIELFKTKHSVSDYYKEKFHEIIIDEYQDNNAIQDLLISKISKNNIVAIGDIKQSIYRFRFAEPNNFISKVKDSSYKLYNLSTNRRSTKQIITFVNSFFDHLISDEKLSKYKYSDGHHMKYVEDKDNVAGIQSGFHGLLLDKADITSTEDERVSSKKVLMHEAVGVVNKIISLLNDENALIFDSDTKSNRRLRFSDFAIISRKNSILKTYQKELESRSIPVINHTAERYFFNDEILVIYNLLIIASCYYNRMLDLNIRHALYAILNSFIFEFDEDELSKFFLDNPIIDFDIIKQSKYHIVVDILDNIDGRNLDLYALYLELIKRFKILVNIVKLPNSRKRVKRVVYFASIIKDELGKNTSIISFLKKLKDILKLFDVESSDNDDFEYVDDSGEKNAIELLTIHKSKGLEFNIIFFVGLTSPFKEVTDSVYYLQDDLKIVIPSFRVTDSFRRYRESIFSTIAKLSIKKDEYAERLRLLYVAFTRVKYVGYIVYDYEASSEMITRNIYQEISLKSLEKILIAFLDPNLLVSKELLVVNKTVQLLANIETPKTSELELIKKSVTVKEMQVVGVTTSNQIYNIDFLSDGKKFHEYLSLIYFKNISRNNIPPMINNFINSPLLKANLPDATIYQEHEFIFESTHGIIDLLLVKDDVAIIIDYKLNDISKIEYEKQLKTYANYVSKRFKRKVEMYLYSIVKNEFLKIN